jgi:PAS domain S-box-containing protein
MGQEGKEWYMAQSKPIAQGIDITERKQAEETRRKSEEKYRSILENITEGYFENDLHGNLTFFNDSLVEVYGYTRDELMQMNYHQYMDEENVQKVSQAYNKVYTTGEPDGGIQFEIIRKDGIKRCLENSVGLMRDTDGQPAGFRGISRDVTKRKQIEETLRLSEERYRSILDIIGDAYTEIDLAGNMTFINKESFKFLGYSEAEFVGMGYKNYTTPENAKKLFEIYNRIYRTGEPARLVEYELTAKDGTAKIAEATTELMRDKSGNPIGFRTITRDITQKKQMEEALRQSEERYRTIIENIQDGYFEDDLAGKFTFVNDMICKHLGYSREEMIGMSNRLFQDEINAQKANQAFKEVYETGEPIKALDMEIIRKDGTIRFSEVSVSLMRDAQGKPIGFRGISRDVTERRKAEEQLKRYAAELERSNEEVKNFAYIVSHDLRVPLVNLKGYTSELRSALGVIGSNFDAALPHLNDEKRSEVAMALHEDVPEALEFITNSVSRMDSFINAILILARLGRQDLKPEPIDMNALVKTTVETMSHQLQERGIEVIVGALPHVAADRTSMEQVMGNILSNAVKYLDSSRPGRIEVTAQANGAETTFRIRDNGRGIAAEDMHKVFAPFRRAGKQDTPGEGMGLAYVQTLLRRHGGRISCESELGKGTTFIFTIATRSEKGARDA